MIVENAGVFGVSIQQNGHVALTGSLEHQLFRSAAIRDAELFFGGQSVVRRCCGCIS